MKLGIGCCALSCAYKYKTTASRCIGRTLHSECSASRKYRVIYYGTDEFSLTTLRALNENRLSCSKDSIIGTLDVICIKDCAVYKYCCSKNLTVYEWPFIVPNDVYDIGVVIAFGHLIQAKSIKACKYGIINAHPSLLPRWRGASPMVSSILHGDKETGVTIFQISPKKFDVGRVLLQRAIPIPEKCTRKMLENMLAPMCSEMILETLKNLPHLLKFSYPQPEEGATLAKKIHPHVGEIDWNSEGVIDIDRKFRALNGIVKLYSFWKDKKVSLLEFIDIETVSACKIDSLVQKEVPNGYCFYHKKRKIMFIKCKDGWIGVSSCIVPNRGEISARDFYNGFITKVNSQDCVFHTSQNKDIL